MLEYGVKPSVFFRFPGLVSSKDKVVELKEMGLIPVGSDAILLKKQMPKSGSVIMVDGSRAKEKDEYASKIFEKYLQLNPDIKLLDLRKNVPMTDETISRTKQLKNNPEKMFKEFN